MGQRWEQEAQLGGGCSIRGSHLLPPLYSRHPAPQQHLHPALDLPPPFPPVPWMGFAQLSAQGGIPTGLIPTFDHRDWFREKHVTHFKPTR